MAPCKPAKSLTVHVPRQNAQRIGPSLTAQVQTVGRQDNIIVHMPPPVQEQPGSAGPSSVCLEGYSVITMRLPTL